LPAINLGAILDGHPRRTGAVVGLLYALPLGAFMTLAVRSWQINLYGSTFAIAPVAAALAGAGMVKVAREHRVGGWFGMVILTTTWGILLWPLVAVAAPFWTGQLSCMTLYTTATYCGPTTGLSAWQIVSDGLDQVPTWFRFSPFGILLAIPYLPAVVVLATVWSYTTRRLLGPPPTY
jgi:hypothetical protein